MNRRKLAFARSVRHPGTLATAGLLALLMLVGVLALAQEPVGATPPPPLRGPLHFVELPKTAPLSVTPSWPPTPTIVLWTENFSNFYQPNSLWQVMTGTQYTADPSPFMWGQVMSSPDEFVDTLWSTGSVSHTNPSGQAYVRNMETWVVYGPLDTTQYRNFQVQFDYYLDSGSDTVFGWASSTNGTDFCGVTVNGSHTGWNRNRVFSLTGCAGQAGGPYYLGFFFRSGSGTPNGMGVFLDNVVLRADPWVKTYLPLVPRDPTPTGGAPGGPGQLVKTYDFEGTNTGWCPSVGSAEGDAQAGFLGLGTNNAAYFTTVRNEAYNLMLSPRYTTPANYRITAKFAIKHFNTDFNLADVGGSQLGLVFAVDGDTFSGSDPCSQGQQDIGGYNKFYLRISSGGTTWRTGLERHTDGGTATVVGSTDLPSGVTISRTDWNTLTIDRNGSGIVAYINGTKVMDTTDGAYVGGRYFGIYAETRGIANRSWEVDWDNIQIYNLTP